MYFKLPKRHGYFAASITVLGLMTSTALAGPASDYTDNYNAWYLANGAETASYEKVVENGDDAEILNYKISGMFSFQPDDEAEKFGLYYIVNIPSSFYEGGARSGDTFSFDRIAAEEMQLELGFFEDSGGIDSVAKAQGVADAIKITANIKGTEFNAYKETWADKPVLKDGITLEEFQQLLDGVGLISYDRMAIAEITGELLPVTIAKADKDAPDVVAQFLAKDYVAMGYDGGVTEKTTLAESSYTIGGVDIADGSKSITTSSSYNLETQHQDIRPILALLGSGEAPSDLVTGLSRMGSSSYTMEVTGGRASSPVGYMKITTGSSETKDLRMSGGDSKKLLALLQTLIDDKSDTALEDNIFDLLDALGTFSLGYSDVNDIAVKIWDPVRAQNKDSKTPSFDGTLKHASISDVTPNSIGQVKVEGLHGAIEGDDAVIDLGTFELANIAWPSARTFVEVAEADEDDIATLMKGVPTVGLLAVSGIKVIADELPGPIALDEFRIAMEDHIGPIPTRIEHNISGLSYATEMVEEPQMREVLERLGIKQMNSSQDFVIAWDEATQDLRIEKLNVVLEGGLNLSADITLGGIPRSVFEDPSQAEALIATATFKSAQIELLDSPLVPALVDMQAEQAGLDGEMLSSMMIDGLLQGLGPVATTDFAVELAAAAKSYATKAGDLRVTFAPSAPVPLMQVGGLAALAPQEIPGVLGASVNYSE